jgi:hypothetical protein
MLCLHEHKLRKCRALAEQSAGIGELAGLAALARGAQAGQHPDAQAPDSGRRRVVPAPRIELGTADRATRCERAYTLVALRTVGGTGPDHDAKIVVRNPQRQFNGVAELRARLACRPRSRRSTTGRLVLL